ncbi:hypothetical protein JOL79_01355 [Microbispora sp. RL4-1S]|uniref:Solute-binding protein family 5 domain-containing protein n=1 Tax=Microbispora oryzae TaxID=2806554 RepID=A0A940WKY3_9ACTN|nr:ABC transporter substrate-binding protein [Microbispora oryzae]MBP2702444.1 hypothetical protein [Microbispora oryzae]
MIAAFIPEETVSHRGLGLALTLVSSALVVGTPPVRARNFVEAWNLAASSKRGASYLFQDIKGYGARRMSGLTVVDDLTFTIELNRPFGPFVKKLGQVAFSPLPDATLKRPSSLAAHPVVDGPFRLVSGTPGSGAVLARFGGYAGTLRTNVTGVRYTTFRDAGQGYSALLAGDVDFVDLIPAAKAGSFRQDLGGRVVDRPGGTLETIDFPLSLHTGADVRKAISAAIDRAAIVRSAFSGARSAAS